MTVKTDIIQSLNPATESILEEIPVTQSSRIEEILNKAAEAQPGWASRSIEDRRSVVEEAAQNLEDQLDPFAEKITQEQGKPLSEARREAQSSLDRIRYFCARAEEDLTPRRIPVDDGTTGRVRAQPHGVVAAIKPWNFPLNIPLWTLVPALLAGNTVVFKPSELTPILGRKIIELFPETLHRGNIINLVQGSGEAGRQIVNSPRVDSVSFVGSRATGEWIYRASAEHLRTVHLELGGKDPMIVLEDADLDAALEGLVQGALRNCGQVCSGIERCLVPETRFEEFREELVRRVRSLTVGVGTDPDTDVGPMIRSTERERVKDHLRDAEDQGAQIKYCKNTPDTERGFWQAPAVVSQVTTDMKIMNEETFGPVVALISYGNVEAAIREANRLDYGLGASVYGEDPGRLRDVADRVEAGNIGLNKPVGSIVELPWGGVKKSGVGRLLGEDGLRGFTEPVTERWPPGKLGS